MYILTLKTRKEDGAYAVQDKHGDKVLFLFEEEDDAENIQDVEMLLPVQWDDQPSGNQSPPLMQHNRFTT